METYHLKLPSTPRAPILISVPHCGTAFPDEIRDQYDPELIGAPDDTDWFVDRLYSFAPSLGVTMITAVLSRWVIDLNRSPDSKPLYTDGRIITGLLGIVWSIATFFVVPIIAYENLGPIAAFKRSVQLMKQKWGESLGATFSFGLIQFLAMIILAIPCFFIGSMIHPFAGIAIWLMGAFILSAIFSAAQTIFVSAVYHNITDEPVKHFNQQMIDDLFQKK